MDDRAAGGREVWRRYGRWALGAGALAVNLAVFISSDLGDLSGDSARYLLLGRALAEGAGYIETWTPGSPPHTEFGPGLPILLAPLLYLFPASILPAKALMYLCLAISAGGLYFLMRALDPGGEPWRAALPALTLLTLPSLGRFANQALSDLPYTAVSIAGLALVCRALNRQKTPPRSWFFLGLILGAAFFFRPTGLALGAGAVAGMLFHRAFPRRQRLTAAGLLGLGFSIPVAIWLARNFAVSGSLDPAHLDKLFMARDADPFAGGIGAGGLLLRTGKGFVSYFRESAGLIFDLAWPRVPAVFRIAVPGLVILPALCGLLGPGRSRRGPLEWYLVFYVLIICAWQSHNPRYLIPVMPLALALAGGGLSSLSRFIPGRTPMIFFPAVIALNFAVLAADWAVIRRAPVTPALGDTGPIAWGRWYQYPDLAESGDPEAAALRYHRLLAAAAWMREGVPADAVVMTRKPSLVSYYSGRRCAQYYAELDAEAFWRRCREDRVAYFLVDEVSPGVRSVFGAHLERLSPGSDYNLVFSLGGTHVIQYEWRVEIESD